MTELALLFASAVLVNNFVLTRFLGICPFLGVSKEVETSIGMGVATTFVMTLAGAVTWLIQTFILEPFNLPFLQYVAFILVIASLVQFVELVIQKTSPSLYQGMGIFLPLITTNCAILGLALLAVTNAYNFIQTLVFALGAGVGFTLALLILAGIRSELQFADVPKPFQGAPIALIVAGLISLAFAGFAGLINL